MGGVKHTLKARGWIDDGWIGWWIAKVDKKWVGGWFLVSS